MKARRRKKRKESRGERIARAIADSFLTSMAYALGMILASHMAKIYYPPKVRRKKRRKPRAKSQR